MVQSFLSVGIHDACCRTLWPIKKWVFKTFPTNFLRSPFA